MFDKMRITSWKRLGDLSLKVLGTPNTKRPPNKISGALAAVRSPRVRWVYNGSNKIAPNNPHAHTHLLRNILSNYCCGVHQACTKQSPKIWQAKVGWQGRKTSVEEFFLCPCYKQLFHLMKSTEIQIAKTVRWIETCLHRSSEEGSDAA